MISTLYSQTMLNIGVFTVTVLHISDVEFKE